MTRWKRTLTTVATSLLSIASIELTGASPDAWASRRFGKYAKPCTLSGIEVRWAFTMTEAWAWGQETEELAYRLASPWDTPPRRPNHADKRRAWRRGLLGEEIRAVLRPGVTEAEIQATEERLLGLAA
jgi:hypothetical protein